MFAFLVLLPLTFGYRSELLHKQVELPELTAALPHTYTKKEDLPKNWDWSNIDGSSFVTKNLNQHIPQYCGSCWAHAALSSLADRVKIQRKNLGQEINLSIQYILNCATESAGSCHGGDALPTWEFIKKSGGVPFDTCLVYEACSAESTEGHCKDNSENFKCKPENICRTCNTFDEFGGKCTAILQYPNVTVAEYGRVSSDVHEIKSEIFRRGPVAASINAEPIVNYKGGIFNDADADKGTNHAVSVIGWGFDEESQQEYWIVRNSWGQYWGELGLFKVLTGKNVIGIESDVAWVTPKGWTEHNVPCGEGGDGCNHQLYMDPGHLFTQ